MQTFDLIARSNVSFQLTLDMTAWFAAYPDFANATFRAAVVAAADYPASAGSVPSVQLGFSSAPADGAAGTMVLDPVAKTLRLFAPQAPVARLLGAYVYDCVMLLDGRVVPVIGGALTFEQGLA